MSNPDSAAPIQSGVSLAFVTTHWSVVLLAGGSESPEASSALETNGAQIGRYVMPMANGERGHLAVVAGRTLSDWWGKRPETNTNLVVAWYGANDRTRRARFHLRLFKSTWENPRPDVVVRTIDFEAAHDKAGPFLIAVTAE